MTEIEAKDVGSGEEERFDHFEGRRRGTESGELLRALAPALRELGNGGNRCWLLERYAGHIFLSDDDGSGGIGSGGCKGRWTCP